MKVKVFEASTLSNRRKKSVPLNAVNAAFNLPGQSLSQSPLLLHISEDQEAHAVPPPQGGRHHDDQVQGHKRCERLRLLDHQDQASKSTLQNVLLNEDSLHLHLHLHPSLRLYLQTEEKEMEEEEEEEEASSPANNMRVRSIQCRNNTASIVAPHLYAEEEQEEEEEEEEEEEGGSEKSRTLNRGREMTHS
ncbi:hypothetical protein GBF38_001327 [Nibea albiflora]|uniref:Uncharacterized protein n=1 Tax=Nibea albiflora TaxID=240163 RepID=A0ACB7EUF6_NIBAL|nr:hypothetical protein GBF38_001327 [Nibea albiflora]